MPSVTIPNPTNIATEYTRYFSLDDKEDYLHLRKIMTMYVNTDCWGVSCDDDFLFESFTTKSKRERILDSVIRDKLGDIDELASTLLCDIIRHDKESTIRIYMFYNDTYTINVTYLPETRMFRVDKIWSTDKTVLCTNEEDDEQMDDY